MIRDIFHNMPPRTKLVLGIEIAVAVLILIGGIFLLALEGHAPTVTPSVSATPEFSTYASPILQISFQYPSGWTVDPGYNGVLGLERYKSPDVAETGFFRVDATNNPIAPKNSIVKKYPKPIKIGITTYRYFLLEADPAHLKSIAATITFQQP